ncbi:MAG TPA: NAD(P)(+) transhydrogenase (Re/Si-specific) subunit beta [Anaerolineae bacterium]|nr:NAD(P)(+) transhydrogenase (Re/Si-specific) subunit beta [Anaerolineae bacterium]HMR67990.1 NAD(P)(+) transhydrogenase (Re/Si-specific) subunit beta [Anaerolineae bacterium]
MSLELLINLAYIVASVLFIIGLKMLSSPASARRGNLLSALGMFIAIIVTLADREVIGYQWILVGGVIGSAIGVAAARLIAMTAMPEMVALLNGAGGLASMLVAWSEYQRQAEISTFTAAIIALTVLIGAVTFTGSVLAWGKLSERFYSKPVLFQGQQVVNGLILLGILVCSVIFTLNPGQSYWALMVLMALSLILGVMSVIPIGGADMPVVISLLNSYSGLAACTSGFVIINNLLIVAGALVGASGIILTNIMCKAMNRSLTNVLFSGFGSATSGGTKVEGEAKPISVEDAYLVLEAAASVIFVPGYGLAVAQAQHAVRELGELLESNGAEVTYAIHPVAGRMPGHMNVLLAEANVPYDQLAEMDDVNPIMETVDVAIVVGANDVVNPAAREDKSSPLWGMPIIDVDKARTVIVLKRSMRSGFAGVDNPLFVKQNSRMLFGDAKASVQGLVREFKGS